jgi:ribA/ribD-fused uncharacterized protein
VIDSFSAEFRFLSNFFPCKVKFDGVTYASVEHAYQASKTLDDQERDQIKRASVRDAKRLGRKVKLRSDFDHQKLNIMEDLLRQKFAKDSEFAELLLLTGDEKLVEGNTWGDVFWGVCDGKGENHLGSLLMKIRDELKQ